MGFKTISIGTFFGLPVTATAHTGHLADLTGHDHVVAGAAIGIAIVIGAIGVLADKSKNKGDEEDVSEDDTDAQVGAEA